MEGEALTISMRESLRRNPARCPSDRGPRKSHQANDSQTAANGDRLGKAEALLHF